MTRTRRRRWPWAFAVLGPALVIGALLWQMVAVPALVRFPTDLDQSARYEGTFTLFIDPATAMPLSTPEVQPLAVDRVVKAVPGESSRDLVVVDETVTVKAGDLPDAVFVHRYVMDRRSMENVADARAWAFSPANPIDRSGTYWINLPMKLEPGGTEPIFKDEIGTSFTAAISEQALPEEPHGLTLYAMTSAEEFLPLTDAYLAALSEVVPMPTQLTLDQLKPSLLAKGVDVDKTLGALLPVITPDDLALLVEAAGKPIALQYVMSFGGLVGVDQRSGAVVDARDLTETTYAMPDPAALPPLLSVLEKYRQVPEVAAAIDGLVALQASPIAVFEYKYAQTAASVDEVAATVADNVAMMQLAERTVPMAMFAGGIPLTLFGAGFAFMRLRRRPEKPGAVPAEPPATELGPDDAITLPALSDDDLAALLTTDEVVVPGADGRPVAVK